MPFSPIVDVLEDLKAGKPIVLVDDEDRENEGDIVYAAEKVTPEAINFMVRHACGLLGLSLAPDICERLHLEPLPGKNVDPQATPWTPHIDARTGITTASVGIRPLTASLASTGSDANGMTLAALALLVLGGVLVGARRLTVSKR